MRICQIPRRLKRRALRRNRDGGQQNGRKVPAFEGVTALLRGVTLSEGLDFSLSSIGVSGLFSFDEAMRKETRRCIKVMPDKLVHASSLLML